MQTCGKIIVLAISLLVINCSSIEQSPFPTVSNTPVGLRKYPAHVIKVYDGDTVTARMDLGFNLTITDNIRLYGINAPEVRGIERPQGLISRDALSAMILDKDIVIVVPDNERDKYGRVLGILLQDGVNLNEKLVELDLAIRKIY